MKISLKHLHSQTVRARKLTFWEKVHLLPPVTCFVSCVTCHLSCVTCNFIYFVFVFDKVVKPVDGGFVINGATPSSLDRTFISVAQNQTYILLTTFSLQPVFVLKQQERLCRRISIFFNLNFYNENNKSIQEWIFFYLFYLRHIIDDTYFCRLLFHVCSLRPHNLLCFLLPFLHHGDISNRNWLCLCEDFMSLIKFEFYNFFLISWIKIAGLIYWRLRQQ